jgi:hypothetical protein
MCLQSYRYLIHFAGLLRNLQANASLPQTCMSLLRKIANKFNNLYKARNFFEKYLLFR